MLDTRMATNLTQSHSIKPDKRVFWSDSKTVLSWIKSDARKYQQFVAFRASEIREHTNSDEWRYVPLALNVADEATKWSKNPNFESTSRWYHGPDFLYHNMLDWPDDCVVETTEEELRPQHHHSLSTPLIQYEAFSSFPVLRRKIMIILRFVYNARAKSKGLLKRTQPVFNFCDRDEYRDAEKCLYRLVQREVYTNEANILEENRGRSTEDFKFVNKSSPIFATNPYMDDDGLIRANGRINAAKGVQDLVKQPIILPRDHHVTNLIVHFYHRKFHHQNDETVTNEIRQIFSIPKLRVVVKKVAKSCQWCKIVKANPEPPMMVDLPEARMQSYTRPFSFCGIDYFGPMLVKVGRRTEKRWGVLITCLTTRAIHIEIAHSLTTDSCILCLRNFMARRGVPTEIYSDNGTNLKGASRELNEALLEVDRNIMMKELSSPNTKWKFNPPAAPHMGGVWERLVQSVKKTLNQISVTQNPSDDLLNSMMLEVENIINTRPLTYLPLDSDQDEALTPNHFILGSSSGIKPISEFSDENAVLRRN